ncbi:unnamed protein product [Polarella glacialis]|uniref:Uncharacterized protein n=1 Tax=Polarella glacialis TaxID=89957 RepID=A0A813I779_POLGL|nr:unnamed protein product [Polarella glacialis]
MGYSLGARVLSVAVAVGVGLTTYIIQPLDFQFDARVVHATGHDFLQHDGAAIPSVTDPTTMTSTTLMAADLQPKTSTTLTAADLQPMTTHLPTTTLPPELTRNTSRSRKVHLLSHRSCSQDQSAACNEGFIREMENTRQRAEKNPRIDQLHLYTILADEFMSDPKWARHGLPNVRGRGFWFWKPALVNLLMSKSIIAENDTIAWVDADAVAACRSSQKLSPG